MNDRQGGAVIALGALIGWGGALWSWQMFHDPALLMGLGLLGIAIGCLGAFSVRKEQTRYGTGEQLIVLVILFVLLYVLYQWGAG